VIWQECKRRMTEQQSRVLERQQQQHRASMRNAWRCRSFLGVLTLEEVKEQRLWLLQQSDVKRHFYYLSKFTPGRFCAISVYEGRARNNWQSTTLRDETFEKVKERIEFFTTFHHLDSEPLDRSDAVLFIALAKKHARKAILMWSLCAKRLPIVRDVVRYIAQLLWQDLKVWIP